jgi:hypothetical protein
MRWHANGKASSTFASVSSAVCKLCGGICTWVVKSSGIGDLRGGLPEAVAGRPVARPTPLSPWER